MPDPARRFDRSPDAGRGRTHETPWKALGAGSVGRTLWCLRCQGQQRSHLRVAAARVLPVSTEATPLDPQSDVTDGIPIGIVWKSAGRTLTEGEFALLHDLSWAVTGVHTDIELARAVGIKERNLSGPLVIAVALGLIGVTTMRRVLPPLRIRMLFLLGITNARFPNPLFPGDTIHVTTELTSARASRDQVGRGVMTLVDRVYNHDETLLCEFERTVLYDREVPTD